MVDMDSMNQRACFPCCIPDPLTPCDMTPWFLFHCALNAVHHVPADTRSTLAFPWFRMYCPLQILDTDRRQERCRCVFRFKKDTENHLLLTILPWPIIHLCLFSHTWWPLINNWEYSFNTVLCHEAHRLFHHPSSTHVPEPSNLSLFCPVSQRLSLLS